MTDIEISHRIIHGAHTGMNIYDLFKSSKTHHDPSGCINWLGRINNVGYGSCFFNRKAYLAHRLAYQLNHMCTIDDDDVIIHTCDNKLCVNPDHMKIGTQMDNIHDAMNKGRNPHGETHGCSKLSERDVALIRVMHKDGITGRSIAKLYKMSESQISNIIRGQHWHD